MPFSHCPHSPNSQRLLRPILGAPPTRNLPRVPRMCPPPGDLLSSGLPQHRPGLSRGTWSYLQPGLISSRPEGSSSRKGLAFPPFSLPSLPTAQHRAGTPFCWMERSLSPTYPSINNFYLKDYPSAFDSLWGSFMSRFSSYPPLTEEDAEAPKRLSDTSPRSPRWRGLDCLRTSS